ncbi:hypothetical protein EDB83DRAFT_2576199 [Lactarius deliciosus]|nr:hypothetical protein EDB83DRAFT_2576199 [Lactarius deliciosus]
MIEPNLLRLPSPTTPSSGCCYSRCTVHQIPLLRLPLTSPGKINRGHDIIARHPTPIPTLVIAMLTAGKAGKSKVARAPSAEAKSSRPEARNPTPPSIHTSSRAPSHLSIVRTQNNTRIDAMAAIYNSAILGYLTAKVLDLAGNALGGLCVTHIIPQNLQKNLSSTRPYDDRWWWHPAFHS